MTILAIDPGNIESAYCLISDYPTIIDAEKVDNEKMLDIVENGLYDKLVIEMIASYGMAVGKSVFDTCVWIGRFIQATDCEYHYIYRAEEKMNICHSMKANDSTIRTALIDRFARHDFKNGKGTKANPDYFYGFRKDMWSAFAVGITYLDKEKI